MKTRSIWLVRHGETTLNAARIVQPPDTPLSEHGKHQARLLAARMATLGVARVLTSDLVRARATAAAIAGVTGARVEESELLRERDFGLDRGTPYAELGRDIFADDYEPPNGETLPQFEERVGHAWQLILERAGTCDGHLAVVTHGLLCRTLAIAWLDLGDEAAPLRFGNTSVTQFATDPPHRVALLNCVAHLGGLADDDRTALAGI